MSATRRALHFVLKIGSLRKNVDFFRDKLGMEVLRHEVFEEGCEAACNGPYSGKWSKTMIGYGPEDDYFVLELTYNYSIGKYSLGNDLQYIKLALDEELFNKVKIGEKSNDSDSLVLHSPDGYKFIVSKGSPSAGKLRDVTEVCLACKSLIKSEDYWSRLLKMKKTDTKNSSKELSLNYDSKSQASLILKQIDEVIEHKAAYGRIAFSCQSEELKPMQKLMEEAGEKILKPYVSLDTPGKATVQVVILADPDGHEICFVGDEGFRELSQVDPKANDLIETSIAEDKSDEWYASKNKIKSEG